jgi:prephenate dehydrogenase
MGKIAIIGLGLIGASLGLAIKRAAPADTEVVGFDRELENGATALKRGAVKHLARGIEGAVADASMVVVATPIVNVRKVFEEIAPLLKQSVVVTDTASTKEDVLRWAREILPANAHFVGGHPMAGKEQSGPWAAEEALFDGRPYAIVPSMNAGAGAVNAVVGLAEAVGAKPFFLDAHEHDAYAAAVSHVPLALSIALFNLARGSTAWPELASLAGPAFRDLTRLTSGSPEMAHDIFLTNREHVGHWLDRYIVELQRLADLIRVDEGETLFRMIAEAQLERDNFITNPPRRKEPNLDPELPSSSESFMSMLTGSLWQQRAEDITKTITERQQKREREERLKRRD